MIKTLIPSSQIASEYSANWKFTAEQIFYTPIHWLAYWNDVEALKYIISIIPADQFHLVMSMTSEAMTPLDIAGKHGSHEAAHFLINYLTEKFSIIKNCFNNNRKLKSN